MVGLPYEKYFSHFKNFILVGDVVGDEEGEVIGEVVGVMGVAIGPVVVFVEFVCTSSSCLRESTSSSSAQNYNFQISHSSVDSE